MEKVIQVKKEPGRPRLLTLDELRQSQSIEPINEGGMDTPGSLKGLKRLWNLRQRSNGSSNNNGQGDSPQVSLPGKG